MLHTDGIERRALPKKQFGVFDCRLAADHPMTQHFPEPLWVPHSRYNDLPEEALQSAGYKILTRSVVAGVDAFAKQDGSFFLYFQGHPEYDGDFAISRIPPRCDALLERRARKLSRLAGKLLR